MARRAMLLPDDGQEMVIWERVRLVNSRWPFGGTDRARLFPWLACRNLDAERLLIATKNSIGT